MFQTNTPHFSLGYRTLFFLDTSEEGMKRKVLEEVDQEFLNLVFSNTMKTELHHSVALLLLSKFAVQHGYLSEDDMEYLKNAAYAVRQEHKDNPDFGRVVPR